MLGTATYSRTRRAAGAASASTGRYVAGAASTISIVASVQPLNGKERLMLPEGERDTIELKAYTRDDVDTDDEVTVDGAVFVVMQVETHGALLDHRKCYLRRKDP